MLRRILLVVGILLVGLLVYMGVSWAKNAWPIKDTSLKNEEIGKLAIGMDEADIRRDYPYYFANRMTLL